MRKVPRPLVALLAASAVVLAGCVARVDSNGWQRQVGWIDEDTGGPPFSAPDTVRAGADFDVTVTTYGSSSCTQADGADVRRVEGVVEITPYDRVPSGGAECTADLAPHPRIVQVRIDEPGAATLRVSGRGSDGIVHFDRVVTVLP